ncbi:hypothetical protein OK142_01135 [Agrobacterium sp. BT-220-3]|nr:hypothetical protein [Agrobacterium sp. BT-220-3]
MNNEIEALVQTTLQAQIIRAFKDAPEAIDALVKSALEMEVDQHGGKPDYHSRQKMPYLAWLVGDQIRNLARAAVIEAVDARREEIKSAVLKAVSAEKLVEGLTETILGTMSESYRMTINFADGSRS